MLLKKPIEGNLGGAVEGDWLGKQEVCPEFTARFEGFGNSCVPSLTVWWVPVRAEKIPPPHMICQNSRISLKAPLLRSPYVKSAT